MMRIDGRHDSTTSDYRGVCVRLKKAALVGGRLAPRAPAPYLNIRMGYRVLGSPVFLSGLPSGTHTQPHKYARLAHFVADQYYFG